MVIKKKTKKVSGNKKNKSKQVKKFKWEVQPAKEKPKKADFVKEPLRWKIPWLGKLLKQKRIEKPLKRDFEEKKVQGSFKWEEKEFISKPRATDFKEKKKKIGWKIPWLEELINPKNKFDEPRATDFVEKKEKQRLVGEGHVTPASSLIGKETHFIVEEETENKSRKLVEEKSERVEEKTTKQRDWIASTILVLVGANYLVFLGMLAGRYLLGINAIDYASLNGLFYAITVVSILLSLFFCLGKNITLGFFYISIILVIYLGLSMFLAKNLFDTISILIILAAILPIEVYNVIYNSER